MIQNPTWFKNKQQSDIKKCKKNEKKTINTKGLKENEIKLRDFEEKKVVVTTSNNVKRRALRSLIVLEASVSKEMQSKNLFKFKK